jgi:purine-binding chemotaxis protein CheW
VKTTPELEMSEVVVFLLGDQRYALPIEAVQEIQQIVAMNEMPDSTPGVVGMINLRGAVIPAVDVRLLLGMEPRGYGLQTPMVIAKVSGGLVALLVDEVEDVATLPEGCLQPPDGIYEMADRLIGVCRLDAGLIFLLDPDRLIVRRNGNVSLPSSAPRRAVTESPTEEAAAAVEAPAKPKRSRKKAV